MKETAILSYFSGRQAAQPLRLPAPPSVVYALSLASIVIGAVAALLSFLSARSFMTESAYSHCSGPLPVPAGVSPTFCWIIAGAGAILSSLSVGCALLLVRAGVSALRRESAAASQHRFWAICWCLVAVPFAACSILDGYASAEICAGQGGYLLHDGVRIAGTELATRMRGDAYLLGLAALAAWLVFPLVVLLVYRLPVVKHYYAGASAIRPLTQSV